MAARKITRQDLREVRGWGRDEKDKIGAFNHSANLSHIMRKLVD